MIFSSIASDSVLGSRSVIVFFLLWLCRRNIISLMDLLVFFIAFVITFGFECYWDVF